MSSDDAKTYLSRRNVPGLFECLMTGLMFHRPTDHIQYLIDCLEKVKVKGQEELRWNMFIEMQRSKTPLPPITPSNGRRPISQERFMTPKEITREIEDEEEEIQGESKAQTPTPLPPIGDRGLPDVPIVFLMGGPGSGKSTQAELLLQKYPGWVTVAMGELLRQEVADKGAADAKWKMVNDLMSRGEMVPEDVVDTLLLSRLRASHNADGFIIQGFPRDMEQATQYDKLVGRVDAVFLLDCEEEALSKQLLERAEDTKRIDNNVNTVAKRIQAFKEKTLPVLKHYDDMEKLFILEGEKEVKEVAEDLAIIFETVVGSKGKLSPVPPKEPRPERVRSACSGKSTPKKARTPEPSFSPQPAEEVPEVLHAHLMPPEVTVKDEGRKPDMPKSPIIFVAGGPGSGKGTQCKQLLSRYTNAVHLSMGDLLRTKISTEGTADEKWGMVTELLRQGDLAPEDVTVEMLTKALKDKPDAHFYLVEGFPRNLEQLEDFNKQIGGQNFTILLDCEESILHYRLMMRGKQSERIDDNMVAIGKKLTFFKNNTLPILKSIDDSGKLVVVDGDRDEDEIQFDLCKVLDFAIYGSLPELPSEMASSADSFKLVYNVVSNGKIPVRMYRSEETQLSVVIAQIEGPLVNGYFCVATEAHDDDGLPHTLEHLIFLGSEDFPYKGVLDLLANRCLASGTNAWTGTDHTCYTMTTAGSEGFLQLLPIYVDHILHPTLKESGYVTEVHHVNGEGEDAGVVYCEMQARENKGESLTHLNMLRAMYPGHCGYKSETGGIMANLRNSTSHEKVCSYHRQFYRPENLCLIITGDVQPQDVFRALQPSLDKIKHKGLQDSFTRPWQSPVPPLPKSVDNTIVFPTDDEEYGMVTVAWRGPFAKDQYQMDAISILLDYLSDSPISPIQRDFVEIEEPYCSQVCQFMIENSETCFGFNFENVDSSHLKDIAPKLEQLLNNIAQGKESLDMDRMANLVHRRELDALNSLEGDYHDSVAGMIIGQFLYGDTQEDFVVRLNTIDTRQKLKMEPEKFWLGLLQTWIHGTNKVVMVGEPSSSYMKKMGEEEKARVEAQRKSLGPEGLDRCRTTLKEAIEKNEVEPPESVLMSVPVPGTDSIHFHTLTPSSNIPSRLGTQNSKFPLTDIPYQFQLDDMSTNFARMMVLLDTSTLPKALKYCLPLMSEVLMESPIMRDGELIPHERVIAELEKDTLYSRVGLGLPPGCFQCGLFPHLLVVGLKVEEEKYQRGVQWLYDVLNGIQFTPERLKIIANRMVGDIPSLKRDGFCIVQTVINNLIFPEINNRNICGMLRQAVFLNQLLEKLESQPDQVVADMNSIREQLLQPHNVRVHLSCDVSKLSQHGSPAEPWKAFLSKSAQATGDGDALHKEMDAILALDNCPLKRVIVGVGDVESAFLLQVVPSISSFHHPDLPALMVLIQYLTQCEGPMWCQIRGHGLCYYYEISIHVDKGLLTLLLEKSSHVVEAYKVGQKIVQDHLNGTIEFSEVKLQSARSSLIFEIIDEERTIWDSAQESVLSYLRGVDHSYNRELVKKVSQVRVEDLKKVGEQYLAPLFDVSVVRSVTCVHPSKVQEVVADFNKLGVDLTTMSLDDERLTSLGLEA